MRGQRNRTHIAFGFTCALIVWLVQISLGAQPNGSARRMSFHNRLLLNRAAVSGLPMLETMILVASGHSVEVASRIHALGGRVTRDEPSIGYLRAELPTATLVELVSNDAVVAYQIASNSRGSWYRDGPPRTNAEMHRGFERVRASRRHATDERSALPTLPVEMSSTAGFTADEDAGVGTWLQDHPTFDGRGVTIAILEASQIEFSHPMLAPAKTIDGRDVPKIAGILNTIADDVPDDTRVRLDEETHARSVWTRLGDRTYALPRPGTFRFGEFALPMDINLIHRFGVLMDVTTREIWVDTNGDTDFRDEAPIPDVNERFEPRPLKLTYPEPAELSFVVSRGRTPDVVHVYLATGGHHTMTTSVAAGSRTPDGLAYGVAPGARVLLVRTHTSDFRMRDLVEGFLDAARRTDVDILSVSTGLWLAPDTAAEFLGLYLSRLLATYRKAIFFSAGNLHLFLNNIHSGGGAFVVGGSLGPPTQSALFGGVSINGLMVHPIGGSGPAIDGALKPDFLAPMQRLAADIYGERAPIGIPTSAPKFELPPGYQISCCTSASAPYAAGVGALLLSAAKQQGLSVPLERFQRALRVGARFLDGWPAHQQGNGVLDVEAAWRELHNEVEIPIIRATASIVHPLAPYSARGNEGQGLFEREGWTAGMAGERVMRFRRASGVVGAVAYRLSWTGNDGTFSAPPSIALPLESDVELRIGIAVRTNGAHSAILNLHDPATDAVVFRTLATVVASELLTEHHSQVRVSGSLAVLRTIPYYYSLGERAGALQITLEVLKGTVGATILPAHSLYPSYYDHVHPLGGQLYRPGIYHVVLPNPAAGVWAVQLSNLGSQNPGDVSSTTGETAEYALTVRLLSATLQPRTLGPGQRAIHVENRGAALEEPRIETSVGTLQARTGDVSKTGLPSRFEIVVPEQAATLALRLQTTDAAKTGMELYLYDCTSGECFIHDFTVPAAPDQTMTVRRPRVGLWVAAVNPGPYPTQPARFVLEDVIAGDVRTHGAPGGRPSRTTWIERITLPVAPHASGGRTPIVLCELVDAAMNREEEAHPWETRVNLGLTNLAGRRPAIGTAICSVK